MRCLLGKNQNIGSGLAMADIVKQILIKPIQLVDQIIKAADEVGSSFKQEHAELKNKTEAPITHGEEFSGNKKRENLFQPAGIASAMKVFHRVHLTTAPCPEMPQKMVAAEVAWPSLGKFS